MQPKQILGHLLLLCLEWQKLLQARQMKSRSYQLHRQLRRPRILLCHQQVPFLLHTSTTSRKSSLGVIVGGTIAGVLIGCLSVILIFWLLRRQRRSRSILDIEKASGSPEGSLYTRPRPYIVTVPPIRKDLPPLTSHVVPSAGGQTSTENSISDAANSDHLEEPTRGDLRKQTQSAREELRSLHQAFLNTPTDISVRGGMINILERLRRLEEQASVNESPPAYMC
ncbi:hypothetical protein F5879DRAFT_555721 [Lentinula edodes]|nr:hypothetical protein F5879DRAFT_555721 [Lentinula edodes]